MGQKIVVGPINKGLRTDVTPFNIDNDSFPVLENAYQWRGRVRRKRGTQNLGRLSKYIGSTDGSGNFSITLPVVPLIHGASTFVVGANIFTDSDITVTASVSLIVIGTGTATLNRTTGALAITGSSAATTVVYYPGTPVMGLESFTSSANQFPLTVAFDQVYSYAINNNSPYNIYATNYYKNPATSVSLPGYTAKTTWTALNWNGQDYQQFWTTNYEGSLWATNGVEVPFDITNVGMQFKAITGVVIDAAGPPAIATLTIVAHGLVQGDFLFINEVGGITGLNFQTGYVVSANPQAANTVQVEFPTSTIGAAYTTGGIAQYLTNTSTTTKDCIRIYDGSPVSSATPPIFSTGSGWVNFAPPLSLSDYSIAGLPADQYYLVGAVAIQQFKDRILFFGPIVQTSAAGSQRYLNDTVIFSQNGTPYYTCTFPYATVNPTAAVLASAVYSPVIVPTDTTVAVSPYTATAPCFFEDVTGYGGFISSGYGQPITTVSSNEDVLILGFTGRQSRFVYTGNDLIPFNFYTINTEYGSSSSFSSINLDRGAISIGPNGIIITSQESAQRIDLEIPDQIFQFNLKNNGIQRICSQRDFLNEWIFFTYSSADNNAISYFPNQTLFYNYRDGSWAIFNESYTTYGTFRKSGGETWDDLTYFTWDEWTDDWDSGESNVEQPEIIAGNTQGFVMVKDEGTGEDVSGLISNIVGSVVNSPNHNLSNGDYIIITGCVGTVSQYVNGRIFSVSNPETNSFSLNPAIPSGTYLGSGVFTRMYVPQIQTKQFPVAWGMARKTRIGNQQYLFSETSKSQITLLIFLSQNGASAYNAGPIIPTPNSQNNSLVYSSILYTCPESTNLGLSASNINIQTPLAENQEQIWHRMNTSLIGDTVQIGFTLSDSQMRELTDSGDAVTITGASKATSCVLTAINSFFANELIRISGVVGMTELNGNVYLIISANSTSITISVDSTGFTTYASGGTATPVSPTYQFSEIELHSMILDVTPSQLLV